ncbi:SPW repeat protein [Rufibacter sediminis]|uniref:SPW repeat protein n=1 Tax=Rufibacter sediminis TaxID=2762756 RepID=A0ABR6VN60_9BACT|nr:SPW repeat protein [Rufibacter sediminis]MBC3538624.1 SPW repeat protein [Rufibacter sediminis]
MKVLSTRTHGIMDYLVGLLLIAAPFILDFDRGGAETWVPIIVGAVIILQNLMTNWEVGAFRALSPNMHITMDYLIGIFLAASPWIFNFDEYVYLPHLIVGIVILLQAMMTRVVPAHGAVTNTRMHHGHTH